MRRTRIPGLIDMVRIADAKTMDELDADHRVDRQFRVNGPFLNRLVQRRLSQTVTVSAVSLPAFRPRNDEAREHARRELEEKLDQISVDDLAKDPHVQKIGDWVRGDFEGPIGVEIQGIVGRVFDEETEVDYHTYRAGQTVDNYLRAGPIQELLARLTGRLGQALRLLTEQAKGNGHAVHAMAIAFHNIERALLEMRAQMRDPGQRLGLSEDNIAQKCLKAPETALRTVQEPIQVASLDDPIQPGTLIAFQLAEIADGSADLGRAFREGSWAQCPAHHYVPNLLRAVYRASVRQGREP